MEPMNNIPKVNQIISRLISISFLRAASPRVQEEAVL
jgi:hypothetical protein